MTIEFTVHGGQHPDCQLCIDFVRTTRAQYGELLVEVCPTCGQPKPDKQNARR